MVSCARLHFLILSSPTSSSPTTTPRYTLFLPIHFKTYERFQIMEGFIKVAKTNPPMKLSGDYSLGNSLIQSDRIWRDPKHVWIIWSHEAPMLLAKYSNICPRVNLHCNPP